MNIDHDFKARLLMMCSKNVDSVDISDLWMIDIDDHHKVAIDLQTFVQFTKELNNEDLQVSIGGSFS